MAVGVAQWTDLLQGEELAYLGSEAARDPITAPLPDDLPADLREQLGSNGITELYSHQAAAWDAAQRGVPRRSANAAGAALKVPTAAGGRGKLVVDA